MLFAFLRQETYFRLWDALTTMALKNNNGQLTALFS